MRNLSNTGLRAFNETLKKDAQKKIITFSEYKKLHSEEKTEKEVLTYEATIASIESVEAVKCGYIIKFDFDKIVTVLFSGTIIIETGGRTTYGGYEPNGTSNKNIDKGHVRLNLNGQSFCIEKLIGICECILADELPETFSGLTVNVLDGTGNIYTAEWLGLKPNYSLDNLEWTLNLDNLTHGRMIKGMYKRTGRVYKFSANDEELIQVYQTKDNDALKEYCKKLIAVK